MSSSNPILGKWRLPSCYLVSITISLENSDLLVERQISGRELLGSYIHGMVATVED